MTTITETQTITESGTAAKTPSTVTASKKTSKGAKGNKKNTDFLKILTKVIITHKSYAELKTLFLIPGAFDQPLRSRPV